MWCAVHRDGAQHGVACVTCVLQYCDTVILYYCPLPAAMEKQLEELRQQLEKQCQINQELKRQNKDLGRRNTTTTATTTTSTTHKQQYTKPKMLSNL